jgi:alpha-beta hydrolase superfamily lysophospholipase
MVKTSTFSFTDPGGVEIQCYRWLPDAGQPKACVQIAHGQSDHVTRYEPFVEFLTAAGFACYGDDHRGHGKTAGEPGKRGILGPGGRDAVVKDLKQFTDIIKAENPGKPVFYLGHSWGAHLG